MTTSSKHRLNLESVVVRAFGGEPVEMIVVSDDGHWLEVARSGDAPSIRIAADSAYQMDHRLLAKLVQAHGSADVAKLASLWAEAVPHARR